MRNNFRQGLISYQKDGNGAPQYLLPSSTNGFVALNVSPSPVIATFAHGPANYMEVFNSSVPEAWVMEPGKPNYLYWDIDLLTSNVSFGVTTVPPTTSLFEPADPPTDQHWFDLNTNKMRVWSGTKWMDKVRLFAGVVPSGNEALVMAREAGSQVGLEGGDFQAGFVMLDEQLRPLRTSTGEFLTTDTPIRIRTTVGTSGVLATPPNAFIPIRAGENIPKMALVYFSGPDIVSLASSDPALLGEKTPVGIVLDDLATNEIGALTQSGDITYDQWDWSGHIGRGLYVDSNGALTPTRPNGLMAYRVAIVKNKNTIIFDVDAETLPQVYQASAAEVIIAGSTPISALSSLNSIGERVVTISMPPSTIGSAGYVTVAQANRLETMDARFVAVEGDVADLKTEKADVNHTHVAADIIDLPGILSTKMNANQLFDDRYSLIGHHHDGRYALFVHTHEIPEINGLQNQLNDKASRTLGLLPLNRIFTSVNQSDFVDEGVGSSLDVLLNQKSNVGHTHTIGQVANLQDELDNRAFIMHTHSMAQITGLGAALDGKADASHTHTIGQIINLQPVLNTKADIGHTHSFTDITNFGAGVESQLSAGTNITFDVDPVTRAITMHAAGAPAAPKLIVRDGTTVYTAYTPDVLSFADGITVEEFEQGNLKISVPVPDPKPVSINTLTDVDTNTVAPELNDVLAWDGTNWIPAPPATGGGGGGATALAELTDVLIDPEAPPNPGDILTWDGTTWTNGPAPVIDENLHDRVVASAWRALPDDASLGVEPVDGAGVWYDHALPLGSAQISETLQATVNLTHTPADVGTTDPGLSELQISGSGEYLINFKCRLRISLPVGFDPLTRATGLVRFYARTTGSDLIEPDEAVIWQHDVLADQLPDQVRTVLYNSVGAGALREHDVDLLAQLSCNYKTIRFYVAHMAYADATTAALVEVERPLLRVVRLSSGDFLGPAG